MSGPLRIQRKRTKGWRMPKNTVYVGRPTIWGNEFTIKEEQEFFDKKAQKWVNRKMTVSECVEAYVRWMQMNAHLYDFESLRGKNLACWCAVWARDGKRVPCHADYLLEIANS